MNEDNKTKMFKLNRNRAARSGERIDFNFYQLKALQVPRGWDKLFVSIMSVETGRTIAKLSKASVRSGTCQWAEHVAESIWVPQDDSSKELEDCFYKLVVATGSARSGILGEATINVRTYVQSAATSSVSIPLKKCNHGTILQVKIRCSSPHTKIREDESKGTDSRFEDPNRDSLEEEIRSAGGSGSRSPGGDGDSYTSKELGSSSRPEELESQETTFSSFDSHRTLDSLEQYSPARKKLSGENDASEDSNDFHGRRDSTYAYGVGHASQSNKFLDTAETVDSENLGALCSRIPGSSNDLLEAAENTIRALQSEAKMWERNSQKLMLDLDILRKEFSDQSKKLGRLEIELSEANADRDGLRKELDRMKLLIDEHKGEELYGIRDDSVRPIQKELEEEIRFHNETNSDLALQFSRSQESNLELVSVLQEMEETLEKQKLEIEELKLEQSLSQKLADEKEKDTRQVKEEYEMKFIGLEEEVMSLRAQLSELTDLRRTEELEGRGNEESLAKEIESLKEKLQEVEKDCAELTEENLDLLFKLKETSNGSLHGTVQSYELLSYEYSAKSVSSSDHENQMVKESYDGYDVTVRELEDVKLGLESKNRELGDELVERRAERDVLEQRLRSRESEIEDLQAMVADLESEKVRLAEDLKMMQRESDATLKCLSDLQNDLNNLSSSFDSHVSANRILERKSYELESHKREVEVYAIELERENNEFSVRISDLESEVMSTRRENHGLVEEMGSLRKSNGELEKRNLELNEFCLGLEINLERLRDGFSAKANVLEEKLSLIMEDVALEEKKLLSRLDSLHRENQKCEEEFVQAERVFNQLYVDKAFEVENLQKTVEGLREKVLETDNEREKVLSTFADEISRISGEKAELELSVREFRSQIEVKESELEATKFESENKVKGLMDDLAALRQDRQKLSKMVESRRFGEEKLRTTINELELKLTVSEYERGQLVGEATDLRVQLQKMEQLKNELGEAGSEKEKLKADYMSTLVELEELKGERNACFEKISALEKVVRELEDCRQINISLQEKLIRLENEIGANEAIHAEAMEVRNELTRVRRESRQCQQKMKVLEEERDEHLVKSQALEEELKTVKEEKRSQRYSSGSRNPNMSKANNRISPVNEYMSHTKSETPRSANKPRDARRKPFPKSNQVPEVTKDPQVTPPNTSCLGDFLMEISETDDTSKVPYNRLFADAGDSPRKSTPTSEMVTKEKFERTKSSLETELIELRERYSQMSLRYAEVEGEREELVMKLKATRSAKRWFS